MIQISSLRSYFVRISSVHQISSALCSDLYCTSDLSSALSSDLFSYSRLPSAVGHICLKLFVQISTIHQISLQLYLQISSTQLCNQTSVSALLSSCLVQLGFRLITISWLSFGRLHC
ncbi:hypothetical protein F511_36830 [Dorcoceras hygrometricum]|uniref:Uncharacterized protein n=1 Tax=Dorcoceras hygrometricum TaxID=472368 RepID=A0A2Z7CLT6_9LAMI|nr:hypothetical protein F511_36830 [Dorcoceras hygrometricum]